MKAFSHIRAHLPRLGRDDSGAALVEFAMMLPMMLLMFAVTIEGGRLMWSYQSASAGVRDAARYLARITPPDICTSGGSVAGQQARMETIVREAIGGSAIFPAGITINSVVPSHTCVAGTYRVSPAPVAQVTANMTITFSFSGIFTLVGSSLGNITTTVTDQSRIYGT